MDLTLPPIEPPPVEAPPPPLDSFAPRHFATGDRPLGECLKVSVTHGHNHLTPTERASLHAVQLDPRFQAAALAANGVPPRTEGERELEREAFAALSDPSRGLSDFEGVRAKLVERLKAEGKTELAAQAAAAPADRVLTAASNLSSLRSDRARELARLQSRHPQR